MLKVARVAFWTAVASLAILVMCLVPAVFGISYETGSLPANAVIGSLIMAITCIVIMLISLLADPKLQKEAVRKNN